MKLYYHYAIAGIIIAGMIFCSVHAQQKTMSNLPLKGLLKIWYDDLGTQVILEDTAIRLDFKDRPTDESFSASFTVVLKIKNISKQSLRLPRELNIYGDNAGFYDDYQSNRTEVLHPQKTMNIAFTIYNTGHVDFRKAGYLRVYLEDSSFVRFPISTSVHFYLPDSLKTNLHR